MIKTYDQFIGEGLFSKSVKKVDFFQQYMDLLEKCMIYNIDFVNAQGGEVKVDNTIYAYTSPDSRDEYKVNLTSFKVVKNSEAEVQSAFETEKGFSLFAITDKDEVLPIDSDNVARDTIFEISSILNEVVK